MATIALPLRRIDLARSGTLVPLIVGLVGTLLSWFGSGWHVSWHRIFGRDTFWSTPHLFIYTGVALWGVAAMIATATAMAGRPIRGRALVLGPFRAELGLALIGVGALVTILAGPFDNLWLALFGRDVDIWSPPHLAGIAGGGIGLLGWLAATAPGVFPIDDRLRRLLRLFTLGNLCAVSVFALNFYYITSVTREAFFYPLLVSALVPATLAIATVAIPGRWAATSAALAYTIIALLGYEMLAGSGWRPPAFPPLVIAGAIAIDLLRARAGWLTRSRWASRSRSRLSPRSSCECWCSRRRFRAARSAASSRASPRSTSSTTSRPSRDRGFHSGRWRQSSSERHSRRRAGS